MLMAGVGRVRRSGGRRRQGSDVSTEEAGTGKLLAHQEVLGEVCHGRWRQPCAAQGAHVHSQTRYCLSSLSGYHNFLLNPVINMWKKKPTFDHGLEVFVVYYLFIFFFARFANKILSMGKRSCDVNGENLTPSSSMHYLVCPFKFNK